MLYVVVKRTIKIMTLGHKQVNVGIFFKVTIPVKRHIL